MMGINNKSSLIHELYPLILENINDLIIILKPTYPFEIELINEKVFMNILGYCKEDLIFKSILDYIHPDDTKIISHCLEKEEMSFTILRDLRIREKTGDFKFFKLKSNLIKDSKDRLKLIIILKESSEIEELKKELRDKEERFSDLTNQIPEIRFWKLFNPKKYELALQNSYDMLQRVMDNIPENIFWKDKNLIYQGCNQNYANMIGQENPNKIIGKKDEDLLLNKNKMYGYLKSTT